MEPTETKPAGPPRTKKPNYNLIHANPLPLTVQALPPLIPHNPLSLLQILWTYFFKRQSCLPDPLYVAHFDPSSRTVHVTDPRSMLAFWNNGFFGKGSLSRSEPTWLSRKRRALGLIGKDEDLTAEELTERRRRERREFKAERARLEKEKIEKRLLEEGKLDKPLDTDNTDTTQATVQFAATPEEVATPIAADETPLSKEDVENLEHLQLTLEEAFFLVFGLGVLKITGPGDTPLATKEMFLLFRRYSAFPPLPESAPLQPDDTFMTNYVVYHHFRSLGWVIRPGVKFGVDYLLYNRGPVFSHAEFAVLIMPSYSHPHWANDTKRKSAERKPWHWLHCVNRVSAQVKKTVILVYVDIPPPLEDGADDSISAQLKRYRVREFSVRRWLVSRNRD